MLCRKHFCIVVDLKRRYRNSLNERMNEQRMTNLGINSQDSSDGVWILGFSLILVFCVFLAFYDKNGFIWGG